MSTVLNSVYYNIGSFLYLGAQWIISVILVRLGGFGDAGEFSLAMTVSNIFGMVANYGLRSFQVSDVDNKFSDKTFMTSRIITTAAGFLFCVIYLVAGGYKRDAFLLIIVYMLYKCVEAYSDVLGGIWQKNGNMAAAGLSLGLKGVVNFIAFLVVYLLTKQLLFSVAAMMISSLAVLLTYDFHTTKKYAVQKGLLHNVNFSKVLNLLKYGLYTMIFVLLSSLFTGIPKLVIEHKLSAELLGVFSSVSAPTVLISTFAVGVLLPVVPKMAENYNKKNSSSLLKTIVLCNLVFAAVGVLAALLSFFFGKAVFAFVFGEEILNYFSLFYWLIISSVLIAVVNCYSTFLIAIRHLKTLVGFSVAACVAILVLSVLLIGKFGIYGAAYAMTVVLAIQFIVESIYVICIIKRNGNQNESKVKA